MVWRLGPWQQRLQRHLMLLINGVYAAFWIYTGQSASSTTRSDQEPNNHYCLTQSAPDTFSSLVTSAQLTPVRIILGHCTPVLLICQALKEKTWLAERDPVKNYREWSTVTQSGSGDSSTVCSEQNSLADTCGNGYVADKHWMTTMMMLGVRRSDTVALAAFWTAYVWLLLIAAIVVNCPRSGRHWCNCSPFKHTQWLYPAGLSRCNTRCSIQCRFPHFPVLHFPPLHIAPASSSHTFSCLTLSASPTGLWSVKVIENVAIR